MEQVDCVVVGAGVVGLAAARALAVAGREVIILEAAEAIGTETSSRNSEVIHAGIYYPANSLMARFCVAGRRQLYAYCAEKGVPHINCGKLIVATNVQEDAMLAGIKQRAEVNGVEGMRVLTAAEAIALEPNLSCTSALLSPTTGIIDSHNFMVALQGDAENAGAVSVFFSPVVAGRVAGRGIEIDVGGADPMTLGCRLLINSAGLHAPGLARRISGMPPDRVPPVSLRQRELLYAVWAVAVLAADLSRTGTGRPRRAPDGGSGRPGSVRARCRMDRYPRLHRRPVPLGQLLRGRTEILAGAERRGAATRICRDPPEDRAEGCPRTGFRYSGTANAWCARADQSVRYRKSRTDRRACDRRPCAGSLPVGVVGHFRRHSVTASPG